MTPLQTLQLGELLDKMNTGQTNSSQQKARRLTLKQIAALTGLKIH
jgi:hypothetical protein